MPVYGYKCASCGEEHEALVKMGGDAPVCPKCNADSKLQEKQLSTGTGFLLKGHGWHKYGMHARK